MKSVIEKPPQASANGEKPRMAAKRLRHSADGGYVRGDETRRRIIEAAMQLFGDRGFDGASTRDIAAAANVNAPALQYYFDNKEGVYLACVEHIIEDVSAIFTPSTQRASAALRANSASEGLIEAFLGIYTVMLDSVLMQPQAKQRRLFLAREFNSEEPTVAGKLLERRLRRPVTKVCLALLARISGIALGDPLLRIRMMSLKGQIMPLHHSPRIALQSLGWTRIDTAKSNLIKAALLDQTRVLLESWAERATSFPDTRSSECDGR